MGAKYSTSFDKLISGETIDVKVLEIFEDDDCDTGWAYRVELRGGIPVERMTTAWFHGSNKGHDPSIFLKVGHCYRVHATRNNEHGNILIIDKELGVKE